MAQRIRTARKAAGLSQSEVARKLGVQPSAVNHMESGRTKSLKADTILRLAQTIGVSAYWLETGEGSPSPDNRLTPDETEVLDLYRSLTEQNREAWLKVGVTLAEAQVSKPSISRPFIRAK